MTEIAKYEIPCNFHFSLMSEKSLQIWADALENDELNYTLKLQGDVVGIIPSELVLTWHADRSPDN